MMTAPAVVGIKTTMKTKKCDNQPRLLEVAMMDIKMATPRDGTTDNNRPVVKIKAPSSKQQHSHAGFDDNSIVMP